MLSKGAAMQYMFDKNAPKKPANLSINSDLLASSRNLKINLSATLEQALENRVRATLREQWLVENEKALSLCN